MATLLAFTVVALLGALVVVVFVVGRNKPVRPAAPVPPVDGRFARFLLAGARRFAGEDAALEAQVAMAESPARRRSILAASAALGAAGAFIAVRVVVDAVRLVWSL